MAKRNSAGTELLPYFDRLRALPFATPALLQAPSRSVPAVLELGGQPFELVLLRTHLSKLLAELYVARAKERRTGPPLLLFAPHVSRAMGERLREVGIHYVDQSGNLSLVVGKHSALIEGKAPKTKRSVDRAWRAPSYQALFSYLAKPELLDKPLRTVASEAGVSTTPVLQVRQKLLQPRWIVKTAGGYAWTPPGKREAREFWLRGYQSTLRPSLLVQRFRPRAAPSATDLAEDISQALTGRVPFRWGGATAALRLDGWYKSDRVTIHLEGSVPPTLLYAALRMIPDPEGPVVVLRAPGPVALHSPDLTTVNPLLVWAELLEEGNDRASEGALRVARRFLEEGEGVH